MRIVDVISDKPSERYDQTNSRIRNFSNACKTSFYIALFIYRLQTSRVKKENIQMFIRSVLLRKRTGKLAPRNFCCLFVLQTYSSFLWNLHTHISVHDLKVQVVEDYNVPFRRVRQN